MKETETSNCSCMIVAIVFGSIIKSTIQIQMQARGQSIYRERGYKVVLLGNSGTGKTSLIQYMIKDSPQYNVQPTIVCQGNSITVSAGTEEVDLRVWDTAGQEVYRSLVPVYIRDAMAALLVYDITDRQSFMALEKWYSVLMEEAVTDVSIYIVCNKIDLSQVAVSDEQADALTAQLKAKLFKVSALDGTGVKDLFKQVAIDVSQSDPSYNMSMVTMRAEGGKGCC